MTLEEFWWCRPSVWIVGCIWEGSKCSGADMLFIEKEASPLTHFFPPFTTTDRECWCLHWSFFFAFFPPQPLCVHAGRRCHTAITALNDHVGLDNDYPCQRALNTCGTPAFYRCGRMLWNVPQKKNIAPLVIPLLNAHWRVKKYNILVSCLHFPTYQTRKRCTNVHEICRKFGKSHLYLYFTL